jgi:hypothetical protein
MGFPLWLGTVREPILRTFRGHARWQGVRNIVYLIENIGAPEGIRTPGLCLRRAALYPAELRVLPNGAILADVGVTRQPPCRPARVAKRWHGGNETLPQGESRFLAARASPARLGNKRHAGGGRTAAPDRKPYSARSQAAANFNAC